MVIVGPEPVDLNAVAERLADPSCGASVIFMGRVRGDRDQSGTVTAIDYDAHAALAERALREAGEEMGRLGALRWVLVHRTGQVRTGEISVVVAASAPHRAEAFAACRQGIETVKASAPIWKHVVFSSGDARWAEGTPL